MREERGVKIYTHASFLCKFYPFFEVLRFYFVSVDKFARFKYRIAGVKIEFFLPGTERHCLIHISHKLLGSFCLSGIIARCLYSARERTVVVEARNVVALPAVKRNGNGFKFCDS